MDDQVLAEASVMTNVVTAYERVLFILTPGRLRVSWPVTILGVVPIRRTHLDVALDDITGMRFVARFIPSRFLIVIGAVMAMLAIEMPVWIRAVLGTVAVLFALLSLIIAVRVDTEASSMTVPVCLLRRSKTERFLRQVVAEKAGAP